MKAYALQCNGVNDLEYKAFEMPVPEDDGAVIKVKYCGICGTDTHGIEGKRKIQYPFIPGHEVVARIDSSGKYAHRYIRIFGAESFNIGDRVTINPRIVCGRCYYCKRFPHEQEKCLNAITATSIGSANPPYLLGGWGQYMYLLPGSELIRLPDGLNDELATLVEPLACGVSCVDKYRSLQNTALGDGIKINEPVVIFGAGAIGSLMIAAFHLAGAEEIIVFDADEARLGLAKEFGASHTINVRKTTGEERQALVMDITKGIGAGITVEVCGVPSVINEGVGMLRRGGKLFEIGHLFDAGMAQIDPFKICRNEISIIGNYGYTSSLTMLCAAQILEKQQLPYEKLVEFHEAEDYKDVLIKKKTGGAVKQVFKF